MIDKKIDIVVCSAGGYKDSIFRNGYSELSDNFYNLNFVEFNGKPITEVYNSALDTDSDYIIFCHDDISIEDSQLSKKIDQAIGDNSEYSICGLAGNRKCRVQDKNLWHLMGDGDTMSGAVAHYTGKDNVECFMSKFGLTPKQCILLDGLFLAINVKDVKNVGLRFDEHCPSKWNFYDLNFCMEANRLGLKMTTYPIWVVHRSHGLDTYSDKDWVKGNEYFKNKWSNL
jgi:GT2 family glycosyltransferase